MRGIEEEFQYVDEMVEKLGPKGAAEAFVEARDHIKENPKGGDDKAKRMTAAEWKQVLEVDEMEEREDDILMEGEEEDFAEEAEEEVKPEDEEAAEPAAKKAKTD